MKLKVMEAHKDANRYEVLRQKYIKMGFTNIGEALQNEAFFWWSQRLKKFNKNYK